MEFSLISREHLIRKIQILGYEVQNMPYIDQLRNKSYVWLVTGAAGFIGVNLCIKLLNLGQKIVCIDNLSTGTLNNIKKLKEIARKNECSFEFINGDINNISELLYEDRSIDYISHQAALGLGSKINRISSCN